MKIGQNIESVVTKLFQGTIYCIYSRQNSFNENRPKIRKNARFSIVVCGPMWTDLDLFGPRWCTLEHCGPFETRKTEIQHQFKRATIVRNENVFGHF